MQDCVYLRIPPHRNVAIVGHQVSSDLIVSQALGIRLGASTIVLNT